MSATYTPVALVPEQFRYYGWEEWISGQRDAASKAGLINQTLEDFTKKYAYAVGEDGKFKGPAAGIAYDAEGMTPEEYYNSKIGPQYTSTGWDGDTTLTGFNQSVNADWRPGPNPKGGGFIGGLAKMVSSIGKVAPLRMAAGAMTGGMSEYVFAGANALAGEDPAKIAQNLALAYVGGQLGGAANSAAGGGAAGAAAGSAAKALVSGGNPLLAAVSGGAGHMANDATGMNISPVVNTAISTILGPQQESHRTPIKGSNLAALTAQYSPETVAALIESAKRRSPAMNNDWFGGAA